MRPQPKSNFALNSFSTSKISGFFLASLFAMMIVQAVPIKIKTRIGNGLSPQWKPIAKINHINDGSMVQNIQNRILFEKTGSKGGGAEGGGSV